MNIFLSTIFDSHTKLLLHFSHPNDSIYILISCLIFFVIAIFKANSPSLFDLEHLITALNQSLIAYSTKPNTPTNDFIEKFSSSNNSCPFCSLGNNANYWIGNNGQVLMMSFSALLHTTGRFIKSASYFNLNTSNGVCILFFFPSLCYLG